MLAKPCSSKVRARRAMTCCSTYLWAGSSSGNPLSGVGLLMSEASGDRGGAAHLVLDQVEQERVSRSLAGDAGLLAVAGQHDDVVAQGEHLVAQAAQHRRVVTAGKVGAADRAGEEQVPGEHHLGDVAP